MTHTDLMEILRRVRVEPPYVKGNFARQNALDMAMAASLGFITTQVEWDEFSNRWFITRKGIEVLRAESKSRAAPSPKRRKAATK